MIWITGQLQFALQLQANYIYGPIAFATALSKVLEQVLLSRLARYLWSADSQFGFKQAHGTEFAIFALRQTVEFYRYQDTPVYMCFLDAKMHLI